MLIPQECVGGGGRFRLTSKSYFLSSYYYHFWPNLNIFFTTFLFLLFSVRQLRSAFWKWLQILFFLFRSVSSWLHVIFVSIYLSTVCWIVWKVLHFLNVYHKDLLFRGIILFRALRGFFFFFTARFTLLEGPVVTRVGAYKLNWLVRISEWICLERGHIWWKQEKKSNISIFIKMISIKKIVFLKTK